MSRLSEYEEADRRFWRVVWLMLGSIVVASVLFISLVVMPSNTQRREECEAKGGVLVGKYHDCIKKEYVL